MICMIYKDRCGVKSCSNISKKSAVFCYKSCLLWKRKNKWQSIELSRFSTAWPHKILDSSKSKTCQLDLLERNRINGKLEMKWICFNYFFYWVRSALWPYEISFMQLSCVFESHEDLRWESFCFYYPTMGWNGSGLCLNRTSLWVRIELKSSSIAIFRATCFSNALSYSLIVNL